LVGSFDEFAVLEFGSGADEGDQVGCVDHPPAALGGLDEFERHRDTGRARARAFGDPLPQPHRREGVTTKNSGLSWPFF
jgi:hypothetical protein